MTLLKRKKWRNQKKEKNVCPRELSDSRSHGGPAHSHLSGYTHNYNSKTDGSCSSHPTQKLTGNIFHCSSGYNESSGTRSDSERIYSMGICNSKPNVLAHLDDSVKVMVRHDAKALERKGQTAGGFVPRAPHPMIDAAQNTAKPTEAQEE